ncbi:hypothetical protein KKC94_02085 [Patescibacteria group bacterium]|nr:hypothetical protein [Patescibacteria group bacterium]
MAEEPKMPLETKQPQPAAAPAPKAQEAQNDKNVFTELFGEDQSLKKSDVMDNVMKQEATKSKSFFSKKPKEKTLKLTPKKTVKSNPGRAILQISILFFVLIFGFFYSQNSQKFGLFGLNPAQRKTLAEEQVVQLDSDIIAEKALISVLLLDKYSTVADQYFFSLEQSESQYVSSNKKVAYEEDLKTLRPEMESILTELQDYLAENFDPDQKAAAMDSLRSRSEELRAKSGEVDEVTLLQDVQDLDTAGIILGLDAFRTYITSLDLTEATDDEFKTVLEKYSAEVDQSVISLINSIRDSRIVWSKVFDEFENITKKVDPLFNTEFESNLQVADVNFNTTGFSAVVSGSAITDDTKNFTLISNYVDELNNSDLFENADDRSYAKNLLEDNYQSNFRIGFNITLENL